MKLHRLIVAFILTVSPFWGAVNAQPKEFVLTKQLAVAVVGDKTVTLTENTCRYDKVFLEASFLDDKGKGFYQCYWIGREKIYFQTKGFPMWALDKSKFKLITINI